MSLPVHVVGPELGAVTVGDSITLAGDEGRHAVSVRRLRVGELVECVDGAGTRVRATVTLVEPPATLVATVDSVSIEAPPDPRVVVVQALAKGDRGEAAVEMLTEVGVDEIVPWSAERSIVRWDAERAVSGVGKWRRTSFEAAKQSRRARFVDVADVASTAVVADRLASADVALVLHEAATVALDAITLPTSGEVVIVVGPEGGISEPELAAFAQAGATAVRLGPSVLRTSTAGTVAAALVMSGCGRWVVSPRVQ